MNRRELARKYFKDNNLSYEDIEMNEIYKDYKVEIKKIIDKGINYHE